MSTESEIVAVIKAALVATDPTIPIQEDVNVPFPSPNNRSYAQIAFLEGAQRLETFGGVGGSLERGPLLVYTNIFTPLGDGDGLARDLGNVVKTALRRLKVTGARWQRFDFSPEGVVEGEWRKQIVAVFLRSVRV